MSVSLREREREIEQTERVNEGCERKLCLKINMEREGERERDGERGERELRSERMKDRERDVYMCA